MTVTMKTICHRTWTTSKLELVAQRNDKQIEFGSKDRGCVVLTDMNV